MAIRPAELHDELVRLHACNPSAPVQELATAFVEHHPEQAFEEALELLRDLHAKKERNAKEARWKQSFNR